MYSQLSEIDVIVLTYRLSHINTGYASMRLIKKQILSFILIFFCNQFMQKTTGRGFLLDKEAASARRYCKNMVIFRGKSGERK